MPRLVAKQQPGLVGTAAFAWLHYSAAAKPECCSVRWLSHKSKALEISPTRTAGATATAPPEAESIWAARRSLDRPTTHGRRRGLMRQPRLIATVGYRAARKVDSRKAARA